MYKLKMPLPYRISRACILVPDIMLIDISNIVTGEMQEKLFETKHGDIFEIKGLGTLKVNTVRIETDDIEEKRFNYGFHFRKFIYTCEFI